MPVLIAVLLGLSGLVVVIYPLLGLDREPPGCSSVAPITDVAEREQSARDALREVEFDRRLGNLDEEDYQALRIRYEHRALAALKARYQREQELDALVEQQLDALRQQAGATVGADGIDVVPSQPAAAQLLSASEPGQGRSGTAPSGARSLSGPQARRRRGGRS